MKFTRMRKLLETTAKYCKMRNEMHQQHFEAYVFKLILWTAPIGAIGAAILPM